jgi:hypothetical protein
MPYMQKAQRFVFLELRRSLPDTSTFRHSAFCCLGVEFQGATRQQAKLDKDVRVINAEHIELQIEGPIKGSCIETAMDAWLVAQPKYAEYGLYVRHNMTTSIDTLRSLVQPLLNARYIRVPPSSASNDLFDVIFKPVQKPSSALVKVNNSCNRESRPVTIPSVPVPSAAVTSDEEESTVDSETHTAGRRIKTRDNKEAVTYATYQRRGQNFQTQADYLSHRAQELQQWRERCREASNLIDDCRDGVERGRAAARQNGAM